MAANRRRSTTAYRTYGSVAYAPTYDGSAVRAPRREEELQRAPAPYPRRREQVRKQERPRVQVRQAGAVAPLSVVGFLFVAFLAAMLVTSYTRLTMVNDEMVNLRGELSALKNDYAALTAQYEKVFDLATIQEVVGDTMVRPTNEQVVYIDLSEPDTVTVYQDTAFSPLLSLLSGVGGLFGGVIEYFR